MARKKAENHKTAGQPKKFQSGEELIELFRQFCRYVIDEREYSITPSQTNFCEWLEANRSPVTVRTIYNALNKYFPDVKKDYEQLQSDLLAEGAMTGKYNPTMTIFTLKNWCNWRDKQETEISGGMTLGVAEVDADKALEELGYVKQ